VSIASGFVSHEQGGHGGMSDRWRRFVELPDRERAALLARISVGVVVGLLYALGGVSLYLRAHYLTPTPAVASPTASATPGVQEGVPRVSATLYPTITPCHGDGPNATTTRTSTPTEGESARPSATLFPTQTAQPSPPTEASTPADTPTVWQGTATATRPSLEPSPTRPSQ